MSATTDSGAVPALSVIVPASNEAGWIEPCLRALLASAGVRLQVVVVANGCDDNTAARARALAPDFAARDWALQVIERTAPGKPGALNAGDAAAWHDLRAYLDADVEVSPPLMAQLADALAGDGARYASGTPLVTACGWLARNYARFWQSLPFVARGVPGFGLFAVNAAGRARWGAFPGIISDDTFVRLHFTPAERHKVPARYSWPMIEGFAPLVRVRTRQDQGVAEIAARFPGLVQNAGRTHPGKAWLATRALHDPAGFAVYAGVALAVRLRRLGPGRRRAQPGWARGR